MPTVKVKLTGLEGIQVNLRRVQSNVENSVPDALMAAGQQLLEESQKIVPVEFNDLINSGYVSFRKRGFFNEVSVGYLAYYALYVHEAVEMKLKGLPRPSGQGNYWDPNGRAKFLEEPARTKRGELFKTVAEKVKLV